jgi:hypothetical protein
MRQEGGHRPHLPHVSLQLQHHERTRGRRRSQLRLAGEVVDVDRLVGEERKQSVFVVVGRLKPLLLQVLVRSKLAAYDEPIRRRNNQP